MIKKSTLLFFLLALLCLILGGCGFSLSGADLIRPPKPYGKNNELRIAFEKSVSADVIFKTPISGAYLSSFVLEDIDGDGTEEALVFYAERSQDTTVYINVFTYFDDAWQYACTVTGQGCDVYSIDFIDMNENGVKEIAVSWILLEQSGSKMLSVYDFSPSERALTELSAELFTLKKFIDVDGDGMTEIFLAHMDTSQEKPASFAKVLKMDGDKSVTLIEKRSLDGNVSGYTSIKADEGRQSGHANIYIDANKGESQMITEILYWNSTSQTLSVPLLDNETQCNTQSWRSVRLASRDLDGDGIVEVPVQVELKGGEIWYIDADVSNTFYITNWCNLVGNRLVTVKKSLVNYSESCLFYIPEGWEDRFTVSSYKDTNKWDFYSVDQKTGERDDYMFSVIFSTAENWESNSAELYQGYIVMKEHEDKRLLLSGISDEAGLNISKELLAENFSYYEQ
ncbi:MAG: hypothetical protein FWF05_06505 [Oscillospiraceae bacterium]|nr:hypothetical protein [Oscillospiraceae bacterium]